MSRALVETSCGELLLPPEMEDDLISGALKALGEWGRVESFLLASLLRPDDRFWDVGAFIGTCTLGVERHLTLKKTVSVEANSSMLGYLRDNLARNAKSPNVVEGCAVSATSGQLFAASANSANLGAQCFTSHAEHPESLSVEACTLAQLRARNGDYDALKLDIEGMELDALKGDIEYLRAHKPLLWVECNEDHVSIELMAAMKWLGYDPIYVAFPAFSRRPYRNSAKAPFALAYEAALVAGPTDRVQHLSAPVDEEILLRPVATAGDLRRAMWDTPRWTKPEWAVLSRVELLARLGRMTTGARFADFLLRGESDQNESR